MTNNKMESFLSIAIAKSRSSSEISSSSEETDHPAATCPVPERLEAKRYGWKEIHGFRGNKNWIAPLQLNDQVCSRRGTVGLKCSKVKEYEDEPYVFHQKVKLLAQLILSSRQCCVYSGNIADDSHEAYDCHPEKSRKRRRQKPTLTHHVITALEKTGHVKYLVQQSHDGLSQLSGFPQDKINEIHGSSFDPSNPVVTVGQTLRLDLYRDLLEWEEMADLVLSVGMSNHGGYSSDRLFRGVAQRGIQGTALGGVVIGLRKTNYDHLAALKIFAKSDDVFEALSRHLNIDLRIPRESDSGLNYLCDVASECKTSSSDVFLLPYDGHGNRLPRGNDHIGSEGSCLNFTTLDLQEGANVMIIAGVHKNAVGKVLGKTEEGHYQFEFTIPAISSQNTSGSNADSSTINSKSKVKTGCTDTSKEGSVESVFKCTMGSWWIESASRSQLRFLPVTNVSTTQLLFLSKYFSKSL